VEERRVLTPSGACRRTD